VTRVLWRRCHGGTGPGEADAAIAPPAVTEALGKGEHLEPADGDQVCAGRFDVSEIHTKDLGNPGGFAPAATDAAVLAVVEAADQVAEHGGNNGGAAAASNQADGVAWHWHPPLGMEDGLEHGIQTGEVWDLPQIGGRGGKREGRAGPDEQAKRIKPAERGAEMLPSYAADEAMEFPGRIGRHLASVHLASAGGHLLGGKPDPEIPKLDQPGTVRPPQKAELLDGQKNKASDRLTRVIWLVVHGGSVASLV
jgi:hypothetical protein